MLGGSTGLLKKETLFALVVVEASNVLLIVCLLAYHNKAVHFDFLLVDCTSAIVSICAFVYLYRNFRGTYERQRDTFGQKYLRLLRVPSCCPSSHVCFLYILAFIGAFSMFLIRRSPHAPSVSDAARYGHSRLAVGMLLSFWECYNDSILALALLPQLFMFYNKRPRRVTNLLGTFVAMLFCARVLAFIYWYAVPGPPRDQAVRGGIPPISLIRRFNNLRPQLAALKGLMDSGEASFG
ncbi:hypothetical protein cyc_07276 [Cyclospora cayetanensis]|uniref:Uncharacterized protein n=1 Tax=Cyclospora cayetanensis TaxID=88456 RepID=A0A1D3CZX8_9EIME|nr:hypothetical protein cyc_07276 [Cyclospora cayetanensis]